MDRGREAINRLLDGGLSAGEERELLDLVNSDVLLKAEFDELMDAINMVETSERVAAPASLVSDVMKRLPAKRPSFRARVRDFLFGERLIRWNMATALAAACILIIAVGGSFQLRKNGASVSYVPQSGETARPVSLKFYAPDAAKVAVAGDFNKWSAEKGLMKKESNGMWILQVPLGPGTYHYMFVVDGKSWVTDPNAKTYSDDGFGNRNAVLRVSL